MATSNIKVEIKNLDEIRRAFRKAPALTVKYVNLAIQASIFSIERDAKQNTPVRTGRLRASIGGGTFQGGSYQAGSNRVIKSLYGSIGTDVVYAPYVHDGARGVPARPFLADAVRDNESHIQSLFVDAVQKVLDDIGREV